MTTNASEKYDYKSVVDGWPRMDRWPIDIFRQTPTSELEEGSWSFQQVD
jgi:hypothetical protein